MGLALREVFARFGVEFDDKALQRGEGVVQSVTRKIGDLGAKLTGPAIITGIALFTRGMVAVGQELGDTSAALGLSASNLREWQFVAEASGVSVDAMNSGLQTFSQNALNAARGNGDALYSFRRLGINARDANRELRPMGDLLVETGLQIARVGNPVRRAQLALTHFGEAGRALLPIFERGGLSIAALRDEVRDLTSGDFDELAKQSKEVRAEQARWTLATQAFSTMLALRFLPPFRMVLNGATSMVKWFKKLTESTMIFEAAMVVLGGVFAAQAIRMGAAALVAFAPAVAAAAPYVAAIALIILLVDDLMVLFSGGKSVIGDWLDSFFGAGTAKELIDSLKLAVEQMGGWFTSTGREVFDFFQTNLPAAAETAAAAIYRTYARIAGAVMNLPGIGRVLRLAGVEAPAAELGADARARVRGVARAAPLLASGPLALPLLLGRLLGPQALVGGGVRGWGGALASLVPGGAEYDGRRATMRGFGGAGSLGRGATALQARGRSEVRSTVNVGGVTVNGGAESAEAIGTAVVNRLRAEEREAVSGARRSLVNVVDDQ